MPRKTIAPLLAASVLTVLLPAAAGAGEMPGTDELAQIRQEVESLRGKTFRRDVPTKTFSKQDLRKLLDREFNKQFPGRKLADFQELMVWLNMLPPGTDLKKVYARFLEDQLGGMYDPETKQLCLPGYTPNCMEEVVPDQKVARKAVARFEDSPGITLAHEYTHALDDQYWNLEDLSGQKKKTDNSDRDTAAACVIEGNATRLMLEAMLVQTCRRSPERFAFTWPFFHSSMMEGAIGTIMGASWKSNEVQVPKVPETLVRSEVMPYAYGYSFISGLTHDWGLDGVDYAFTHPPVSTEQVIHPEKYWEWRDLPVAVTLPQTLPGGWTRLAEDTAGEAGICVLFGCSFNNLHHGERIGNGWDGDRAALYGTPDGHRLLLWASAWDSTFAAGRFADACIKLRKRVHNASASTAKDGWIRWVRPDNRVGMLRRDGARVFLIETDTLNALAPSTALPADVTFSEPPEDVVRARANNALLRFNPLLSHRTDDGYTVTRSLWGLFWRHDHNPVGASDRVLLGLAADSHRTSSFNRWSLAWGLAAKHEGEDRRGMHETSLLPWGVLWSHFSARLPSDPADTVTRDSVAWRLAGYWVRSRDTNSFTLLPFGVLWRHSADGSRGKDSCLWGIAGSQTRQKNGQQLRLLPYGLLFRCDTGKSKTAVHLVGTGWSRTTVPAANGGIRAVTKIRLLGFPLYTHDTPAT